MISVAAAVENAQGAEIAHLRDLDLEALRLRWHIAFGRSAPARLPKTLLLRLLVYRLQAQASGDLSRDTRKLLDGLAGGGSPTEKDKPVPIPGQGKLALGTILIREHDGHRHHVMVTETGFTWDGRNYPSLSKVAFAITGTKWNGPRFFGLRDAQP